MWYLLSFCVLQIVTATPNISSDIDFMAICCIVEKLIFCVAVTYISSVISTDFCEVEPHIKPASSNSKALNHFYKDVLDHARDLKWLDRLGRQFRDLEEHKLLTSYFSDLGRKRDIKRRLLHKAKRRNIKRKSQRFYHFPRNKRELHHRRKSRLTDIDNGLTGVLKLEGYKQQRVGRNLDKHKRRTVREENETETKDLLRAGNSKEKDLKIEVDPLQNNPNIDLLGVGEKISALDICTEEFKSGYLTSTKSTETTTYIPFEKTIKNAIRSSEAAKDEDIYPNVLNSGKTGYYPIVRKPSQADNTTNCPSEEGTTLIEVTGSLNNHPEEMTDADYSDSAISTPISTPPSQVAKSSTLLILYSSTSTPMPEQKKIDNNDEDDDDTEEKHIAKKEIILIPRNISSYEVLNSNALKNMIHNENFDPDSPASMISIPSVKYPNQGVYLLNLDDANSNNVKIKNEEPANLIQFEYPNAKQPPNALLKQLTEEDANEAVAEADKLMNVDKEFNERNEQVPNEDKLYNNRLSNVYYDDNELNRVDADNWKLIKNQQNMEDDKITQEQLHDIDIMEYPQQAYSIGDNSIEEFPHAEPLSHKHSNLKPRRKMKKSVGSKLRKLLSYDDTDEVEKRYDRDIDYENGEYAPKDDLTQKLGKLKEFFGFGHENNYNEISDDYPAAENQENFSPDLTDRQFNKEPYTDKFTKQTKVGDPTYNQKLFHQSFLNHFRNNRGNLKDTKEIHHQPNMNLRKLFKQNDSNKIRKDKRESKRREGDYDPTKFVEEDLNAADYIADDYGDENCNKHKTTTCKTTTCKTTTCKTTTCPPTTCPPTTCAPTTCAPTTCSPATIESIITEPIITNPILCYPATNYLTTTESTTCHPITSPPTTTKTTTIKTTTMKTTTTKTTTTTTTTPITSAPTTSLSTILYPSKNRNDIADEEKSFKEEHQAKKEEVAEILAPIRCLPPSNAARNKLIIANETCVEDQILQSAIAPRRARKAKNETPSTPLTTSATTTRDTTTIGNSTTICFNSTTCQTTTTFPQTSTQCSLPEILNRHKLKSANPYKHFVDVYLKNHKYKSNKKMRIARNFITDLFGITTKRNNILAKDNEAYINSLVTENEYTSTMQYNDWDVKRSIQKKDSSRLNKQKRVKRNLRKPTRTRRQSDYDDYNRNEKNFDNYQGMRHLQKYNHRHKFKKVYSHVRPYKHKSIRSARKAPTSSFNTGLPKEFVHHSNEANNEKQQVIRGELSAKIVGGIFNEVKKTPHIYDAIGSYLDNIHQYPSPIPNLDTYHDNEVREDVNRLEGMLHSIMKSLNNIIEEEVKAKTCIHLDPESAKFLQFLTIHHPQKPLHCNDGALCPANDLDPPKQDTFLFLTPTSHPRAPVTTQKPEKCTQDPEGCAKSNPTNQEKNNVVDHSLQNNDDVTGKIDLSVIDFDKIGADLMNVLNSKGRIVHDRLNSEVRPARALQEERDCCVENTEDGDLDTQTIIQELPCKRKVMNGIMSNYKNLSQKDKDKCCELHFYLSQKCYFLNRVWQLFMDNSHKEKCCHNNKFLNLPSKQRRSPTARQSKAEDVKKHEVWTLGDSQAGILKGNSSDKFMKLVKRALYFRNKRNAAKRMKSLLDGSSKKNKLNAWLKVGDSTERTLNFNFDKK